MRDFLHNQKFLKSAAALVYLFSFSFFLNAGRLFCDEFFNGNLIPQATWIRMRFSSADHRSRGAVLQLVRTHIYMYFFLVVVRLLSFLIELMHFLNISMFSYYCVLMRYNDAIWWSEFRSTLKHSIILSKFCFVT